MRFCIYPFIAWFMKFPYAVSLSFASGFLPFLRVSCFWQSFGGFPLSGGRGNSHWTLRGDDHGSATAPIAWFPPLELPVSLLDSFRFPLVEFYPSASLIGEAWTSVARFPSFSRRSRFPFLFYFRFPLPLLPVSFLLCVFCIAGFPAGFPSPNN